MYVKKREIHVVKSTNDVLGLNINHFKRKWLQMSKL